MPFRFPDRWEGREHGPNPLSEAVTRRRAREKSGQDLLDLTVSNPTTVGISFPDDWARLPGGREDADRLLLRYAPEPKGLPSVRKAIAAYYAERDAARGEVAHPPDAVDPDDLFLTAGTSEAYAHLFKILCEPGDALLVPRPSYPLLETLADLAGLKLQTYPLVPDVASDPQDRRGTVAWRLDRKALTAQVTARTRVLCVVQPNNPTGNILSPEDGAWLLAFAEKHNLALVVDEVFADYLHFEPGIPDAGSIPAAPRLRSTGPLVFTLNGLSKLVGLPQLKLAWIHVAGSAGDKAKAKDLLEWICDAHLSVGTASQLAAPELLRRRTEFQNPIRARIAANLSPLREVAASDPRLQPLWPQGGWCLPVRCEGIGDDEEFAIRLVETEGVLVQPGYFFDFEDEEIIVISLLPPPEIFREGLVRLLRALG
jgi:alanine-synthesizing transaminase